MKILKIIEGFPLLQIENWIAFQHFIQIYIFISAASILVLFYFRKNINSSFHKKKMGKW